MVSVTLSVPEEIRKKMKQFPEINWSAFIRKCIEEKAKKLAVKEALLDRFREEKESGFIGWTVELGKKVKEGSAARLRKARIV